MTRIMRSATLQMRVTPGVKRPSEEILHRLGLTMSQAIEMFLLRLILDEKLPFDVVALDEATMARIDAAEAPSQEKSPRTSRSRA
ncbi:MAG: type II toxin-antitoxin system RelB/DinJ family antitoxin [Methylovirgula sp.]